MRWKLFVFALGLGAVTALLSKVLFTADAFAGRDMLRVYYPLRGYWAARVRSGEFPEWFPYDGLGQPFVSMVISAAFHPLNALSLIFEPWLSLKLTVVAAFGLAFLGTYLLVVRLQLGRTAAALAATAYACSGYLVSMTTNVLYLLSAATLPWVGWAAVRLAQSGRARWGLVTATVLAGVFFSGDSESFAVTSGLLLAGAAVLSVRRRGLTPLGVMTAVVALAAALTAVQWIPARLLLPETAVGSQTLALAERWSVSPLRLLELPFGPLYSVSQFDVRWHVASHLLRTDTRGLWASSLQIGAIPVALAAAGLLRPRGRSWPRWAGTAMLLVLLAALGKWLPFYELSFRYLPFWRAFRYPEKLMPFVTLAVAVLAAVGLRSAERSRLDARLASRLLVVLAGGSLLLLAGIFSGAVAEVVTALWAGDHEYLQAGIDQILQHSPLLLMVTLVVSLLGALLLQRGRPRPAVGLGLASLCAIQLVAANRSYIESVPHELLAEPPDTARAILSGGRRPDSTLPRAQERTHFVLVEDLQGAERTQFESMLFLETLLPVTGALWGIETVESYLPAADPRLLSLVPPDTWMTRTSSLFDVGYLLLPSQYYHQSGGDPALILVDHPELDIVLVRNPDAAGRSYLADRRCFATENALLFELERVDPRLSPHVAFQVCSEAEVLHRSDSPGEARIAEWRPERVSVHVQATRPAVLVLNDAYSYGWRARLDDHPASIERTNLVVRGISVPAGEHTVELAYETPGLRPAMWVSGPAWLAVLVAIVWGGRRGPRRPVTLGERSGDRPMPAPGDRT